MRVRRARRTAADHLRSRHRAAPRTATHSAPASSTPTCCSRTCTGITCRVCRSSRRCTTRRRRSTSTGRVRPKASLGDVFAQLMCPPFFPIRPDGLSADVRFHDTGDDDFPIGLAKVRSRCVRHVGLTLGFRVEWNGRVGRVRPRPRSRLLPRRPRRLRAARHPRAVRRRRPAHPRRAAHAARSTSRSATGVTPPSTTPCTSRASRVRSNSCCSITTPATATTCSTPSRCARPIARPRLGGPEVIAAYEGLAIDPRGRSMTRDSSTR